MHLELALELMTGDATDEATSLHVVLCKQLYRRQGTEIMTLYCCVKKKARYIIFSTCMVGLEYFQPYIESRIAYTIVTPLPVLITYSIGGAGPYTVINRKAVGREGLERG